MSLLGCGQKEVRGKIAGKVTFQGQAVSEGLVLFRNDAKGVHMTAKLQPDGGYAIATAKGAGLPLGAYQICICPPPMEPTYDLRPPTLKQYSNIPKKYRDYKTSNLTLTVQEGENPFNIEMKP